MAIGANKLVKTGSAGTTSNSTVTIFTLPWRIGRITSASMVNIIIMIFLTTGIELLVVFMAPVTEMVPVDVSKAGNAAAQQPAVYLLSDQKGVG